MTVVIPFHKGDEDQAERLLKWIAELGQVDAQCVLFCADDCKHDYMLSLALCAFTRAVRRKDVENIKCPWSNKALKSMDASGPNSLFRQVAWSFYLPPKGAWLFLEPDSIPCRRDWYTRLKGEYEQCGKPFMGFKVDQESHPGSNQVPLHLSGVAIYPSKTPELIPEAVRNGQTMAFDVLVARQMIPLSHFTQQIWHHYCSPPLSSMEELDVRCPPHICIYHSDKTFSFAPFLRQRLGMAPNESIAPAPRLVQRAARIGGVWRFNNGQLQRAA